MAFVNTKYEADNGDIHPIRLNTATAGAAGAAPSGAVSNPVKCKVSKTNREFGLRPRGLLLSRDVGTAPNNFKKYRFLPILTATQFQQPESTYNIGGTTWTFVSKVPEDY